MRDAILTVSVLSLLLNPIPFLHVVALVLLVCIVTFLIILWSPLASDVNIPPNE